MKSVLQFICFLFVVASSNIAFAFPTLSAKSPYRFHITYSGGFQHEGIAATSICSASLMRFKTSSDDDKAMLLTNGHCAKAPFGPMLKPGEVFYNKPFDLDADLLDKTGNAITSLHSHLVLYATMTSTDFAIFELTQTYREIEAQTGVKALVLSNAPPASGTPIQLESGYWNRTYQCAVDATVPTLREDVYTFNNAIRYTQPGCEIVGGTSGSPLISMNSGEIIGINNTTNEDGESCTMNNPCEVDRSGAITAVKGRSYGQQTQQIYECLDANHKINLDMAGCTLAKPFNMTASAARLDIVIEDLRPAKGGQVVVGVFDHESSFPKDPNVNLSKILTLDEAGHFTIENVPPGEYAVAVFHDENKNGKIDGFPPREGYAFSNNARGTFGPPSFEKAKLTVAAPSTSISIKMRY